MRLPSQSHGLSLERTQYLSFVSTIAQTEVDMLLNAINWVQIGCTSMSDQDIFYLITYRELLFQVIS